jgi:hypothetical protein
LLLRPLSAERGITVLPSVNPVTERKGAQGVVIAQIFAVKANSVMLLRNKRQLSGRERA